VTWPPAGTNWEGGFTDDLGRRWVHVPWQGWRIATPLWTVHQRRRWWHLLRLPFSRDL
jgi:hypothetical protein